MVCTTATSVHAIWPKKGAWRATRPEVRDHRTRNWHCSVEFKTSKVVKASVTPTTRAAGALFWRQQHDRPGRAAVDLGIN